MFSQKPGRRLITLNFSLATLLSYGLVDEIVAGFPVVGLPLMRNQFHLDYTQAGLLFTVGALSSMLLEPLINILSDRGSKRLWILGGLLALSLSMILAGNAPSYALLLLAFILYYPACDAAVGLAQAALIDHNPGKSTRTMTRWTLLSSIGDFLSPLAVTFIIGLSLGWNTLCWIAAAIWLGLMLLTMLQPFPKTIAKFDEGDEDDTKQMHFWQTVKKALRDPEVLRWSVLALIPTMVDEILLGFATLYLTDVIHASQVEVGLILGVNLAGALLSLFLLDRWPWLAHVANKAPHLLLAMLALLVLAGMIVFLSTHILWLAGMGLFVVNVGAAGWYPIAKARAYAQIPGRAGLVRAIISLGAPLEVALPGIVGLLSARFGLLAGLASLATAPVLILLTLIGYKE